MDLDEMLRSMEMSGDDPRSDELVSEGLLDLQRGLDERTAELERSAELVAEKEAQLAEKEAKLAVREATLEAGTAKLSKDVETLKQAAREASERIRGSLEKKYGELSAQEIAKVRAQAAASLEAVKKDALAAAEAKLAGDRELLFAAFIRERTYAAAHRLRVEYNAKLSVEAIRNEYLKDAQILWNASTWFAQQHDAETSRVLRGFHKRPVADVMTQTAKAYMAAKAVAE